MIAKNPEPNNGGQGGTALGQRDGEERGDLKMIRRALNDGWLKPWQVSSTLLDNLPNFASESLDRSIQKGDERCVLRAIETLRAFQADNLKLAEACDRAERLDADESTDNVGIRVIVEHVEKPRSIE